MNLVKVSFVVILLTCLVSGTALAADGPTLGKYACGIFLSRHYDFIQYITLKAGGEYESSTSGTGHYTYDAAAGRIDFTSGKLQPFFGRIDSGPRPMFRFTPKENANKSTYDQNWSSQVCSLHQ